MGLFSLLFKDKKIKSQNNQANTKTKDQLVQSQIFLKISYTEH